LPSDVPSFVPSSIPSQTPSLSPSMVPSSVPSESPTGTPSQTPSSEPSSLPSVDQSGSPSEVPTCTPATQVSVCIAIDDSGSICGGGLLNNGNLCNNCCDDFCCEAFQDGQNFASQILQGINVAVTFPQYSVVMFSSSGDTIQPLTTSVNSANNAIDSYVYTGQYTNTQDGIKKCKVELVGQPNPIIVLITDGRPNVCGPTGSSCSSSSQAQQAAENAATAAVNNGISIIPVAISDDTITKNAVNEFSRCAGQANPALACPANQDISVGDYDDLTDIIEMLLGSINCNA
jgi:hypothetical protein